uniref:NR LBD domain-containing protein n=1 Tax=Panagrolaimus sp. ES5 TaxID=591445 RepID=A0AC34F757_9BILA
MKVDAVQNERDLIGKRPRGMPPSHMGPPQSAMPSMGNGSSNHIPHSAVYSAFTNSSQQASSSDPLMDSTWDSPPNLLDFLLKAENKIKSLRESVIKETGQFEYAPKTEPLEPFSIFSIGRSATVNDIFHSLHSQLLLVIEWAKSLKPFADLSQGDQMALLKNFSSQHIVLCVAYRSINSFDSLKLLNDSLITRQNGDVHNFPDDFYRRDCERVMDQLVAPMRFMQMDDYEFIAMKACVLFNPVAKGLSGESVMKVLQTRRKIYASLEHYVNSKSVKDPSRVGDLTFFILSPLQSLAKSLSEDVLMTKMSGVARIDHLMEELVLEDSDNKEKPQGVDRQVSEVERKLSHQSTNPHPHDNIGSENAGNYGYDMLSTLSNYIIGPYACNGPLSPLNDPYLTSMVSNKPMPSSSSSNYIPPQSQQQQQQQQQQIPSDSSSPDQPFQHSSSVSPLNTTENNIYSNSSYPQQHQQQPYSSWPPSTGGSNFVNNHNGNSNTIMRESQTSQFQPQQPQPPPLSF